MSVDDVIKVTVDDVDIDRAIAKANQLILLSQTAFGTRDVSKGAKKITDNFKEVLLLSTQTRSQVPDILKTFGSTDLPGVNRELRLILGQVPGMRELVQQYFRLKRVQRSVSIATEEATTLRDVFTNPQLVLTLFATAILFMKTYISYQKAIEAQKKEYERLIRSYKDLTHEEYESVMKEEKNSRRRFPG